MTTVLTGRVKMAATKKKYRVYLLGKGNGCYAHEYSKDFMGETWAVSKKQATSNIHYRIRKNHEELPQPLYDSMGYGFVEYVLVAEEA
jgi:hypothetical protein